MPRLKPPPSQQQPELEDMSPPTEAIEIELPGDDLGTAEVELAPQPVLPKKEEPPQSEPNVLEQQLAAQRRAEDLQRSNAEMQRQLADRDAELARERDGRADAEYNSVLTAIAAEQAALDKAEADYAGYSSVGDFASAGKAQRVMATAAARLDRLEEGKLAFEQKREATPKKETAAPAPQAAPLDFEQRIAQLPESAKSWLRKHPEFVNDTKLNEKIGHAHNYLTQNRNVEAFSPAYFDALDDEFGFKATATPRAEAEPQPQRRSMPVSAPVSRDVPTANGQRQPSSKMTLTQEERQIARSSFTASDMTNEQKELMYAQNKRKLQNMRANGQYPQSERN